ncbi:hypothetical protein ACWDWO_16960 [Actinopolymorpha singaporensis]
MGKRTVIEHAQKVSAGKAVRDREPYVRGETAGTRRGVDTQGVDVAAGAASNM